MGVMINIHSQQYDQYLGHVRKIDEPGIEKSSTKSTDFA